MAALQFNHHLHKIKNFSNKPLEFKKIPLITVRTNCQTPDQGSDRRPEPEKPKLPDSTPPAAGLLGGVMKLGRDLRESLSPKRKGDWNDVVLMSLSFAVYIYMSQKIAPTMKHGLAGHLCAALRPPSCRSRCPPPDRSLRLSPSCSRRHLTSQTPPIIFRFGFLSPRSVSSLFSDLGSPPCSLFKLVLNFRKAKVVVES